MTLSPSRISRASLAGLTLIHSPSVSAFTTVSIRTWRISDMVIHLPPRSAIASCLRLSHRRSSTLIRVVVRGSVVATRRIVAFVAPVVYVTGIPLLGPRVGIRPGLAAPERRPHGLADRLRDLHHHQRH